MIHRPHFLDRTGLVWAVAGTLTSLLVHVGGWAYSGAIVPRCAPSDSTLFCASVWVLFTLTLVPPAMLLLILMSDRRAR